MPQQTGRVEGKKALITGAAQGLGAASAHLLARHGAKVALADINHACAEAVGARINAEFGANTAHAFHLDVRDVHRYTDSRFVSAEVRQGSCGRETVQASASGAP